MANSEVKAAAVKTAALVHRTGTRPGTAMSEARIMSVEYSPTVTRMPRTVMQSWPSRVP
ncbi:hypothetical protein ACH4LT_27590 [Streptomyces clavifer]|uniref:hypothetical protein n=1 Tax=Streptomyces clavifer TaxID=68188 RepID=UPI0037A6E102